IARQVRESAWNCTSDAAAFHVMASALQCTCARVMRTYRGPIGVSRYAMPRIPPPTPLVRDVQVVPSVLVASAPLVPPITAVVPETAMAWIRWAPSVLVREAHAPVAPVGDV